MGDVDTVLSPHLALAMEMSSWSIHLYPTDFGLGHETISVMRKCAEVTATCSEWRLSEASVHVSLLCLARSFLHCTDSPVLARRLSGCGVQA